jgi:hypothetical protein
MRSNLNLAVKELRNILRSLSTPAEPVPRELCNLKGCLGTNNYLFGFGSDL